MDLHFTGYWGLWISQDIHSFELSRVVHYLVYVWAEVFLLSRHKNLLIRRLAQHGEGRNCFPENGIDEEESTGEKAQSLGIIAIFENSCSSFVLWIGMVI